MLDRIFGDFSFNRMNRVREYPQFRNPARFRVFLRLKQNFEMTADRIFPPDSSAPPASSKPGRLDLLDGLRGLAVGAVFLTHLYYYVPTLWKDQQAFDWGPTVMALVPVLWIGVDLFYVLSGFLLDPAF